MLRNARPPFNAAKRKVNVASHGVRLASTIPSSSSAPVPPPSAAGSVSTSRRAPRKDSKPPRLVKLEHDEEPQPKRLLKPHEVSARLHKMCSEGQLDEAIEYLKNLPLDALNTPVWNTIINFAGNAKRYRLAYDLYIEMKRRGFKPKLSTYTTLMSVLSKVDSWTHSTKLLQCAHKTYDNYIEYVSKVKEHNPDSPEISVAPVNAYIILLSKAGDYQRVFDVYNAFDEEGPFSPTEVTYTIMFRTMYRRGTAAAGDEEKAQKLRERVASDARLIWRQITKRVEAGSSLTIDAYVVASVIEVLALGRPADHIVAFDIIRDYVGLAKPGETAPPPRVELSPVLIQDVLWLCNRAQKPRLCVHFMQHLMAHHPDVLDRGHFDHVLTAYGSLSALGSLTEAAHALQTLEWMLEREVTAKDGYRVRPGLPTFTLVLVACWRAKDWDSAVRTFELMTGYRGSDFTDDAAAARDGPPQMQARSKGRNLVPDAAAMSCLVRTALETGDPAAMRQCARIVHAVGASHFLVLEEAEAAASRAGARFKQDQAFYAYKAAQAVVDLVDVLVPRKTGPGDAAPLGREEREWVNVRSEARSFLVAQREHRPRGTPQMEEQPLGSAAGLAATDSAVEWARIHREQKSAR